MELDYVSVAFLSQKRTLLIVLNLAENFARGPRGWISGMNFTKSNNRPQTRPAEVKDWYLSNLPHKIEGLRERHDNYNQPQKDGVNRLVQIKCAYFVITDTFYQWMPTSQILQVCKNFFYPQV